MSGDKAPVRNPPHKWVLLFSLALIIGAVIALLAWGFQFLPEDFSCETLTQLLQNRSANALWAFGLVVGVFVFTGFMFIPVTMVTLAVAAVYGPWLVELCSITGAQVSTWRVWGGHCLASALLSQTLLSWGMILMNGNFFAGV